MTSEPHRIQILSTYSCKIPPNNTGTSSIRHNQSRGSFMLVFLGICWGLSYRTGIKNKGIQEKLQFTYRETSTLYAFKNELQFSSVQSLSCVRLSVTPMDCSTSGFPVHHQSQSLSDTSIVSVMPSSHLILCRPLHLPPSIFPSIGVFSNESVLCIRWTKYWEFQLQHQSFQWIFRLISFRVAWLDLLAAQGLSRVFCNTTVQKR